MSDELIDIRTSLAVSRSPRVEMGDERGDETEANVGVRALPARFR